jgi:hypothetical protein
MPRVTCLLIGEEVELRDQDVLRLGLDTVVRVEVCPLFCYSLEREGRGANAFLPILL